MRERTEAHSRHRRQRSVEQAMQVTALLFHQTSQSCSVPLLPPPRMPLSWPCQCLRGAAESDEFMLLHAFDKAQSSEACCLACTDGK